LDLEESDLELLGEEEEIDVQEITPGEDSELSLPGTVSSSDSEDFASVEDDFHRVPSVHLWLKYGASPKSTEYKEEEKKEHDKYALMSDDNLKPKEVEKWARDKSKRIVRQTRDEMREFEGRAITRWKTINSRRDNTKKKSNKAEGEQKTELTKLHAAQSLEVVEAKLYVDYYNEMDRELSMVLTTKCYKRTNKKRKRSDTSGRKGSSKKQRR
jgi:hypothetical protein